MIKKLRDRIKEATSKINDHINIGFDSLFSQTLFKDNDFNINDSI